MGPLKYIQQIVTEIKEEKHSNTIIVGDLILHLYQWIDHGLGSFVTGFQQLSVSTNSVGPCYTFGFHQLPLHPHSQVLSAEEESEVGNTGKWSCWGRLGDLGQERSQVLAAAIRAWLREGMLAEGSAESWRSLWVTTEGYKETPPSVTRNSQWRLRIT